MVLKKMCVHNIYKKNAKNMVKIHYQLESWFHNKLTNCDGEEQDRMIAIKQNSNLPQFTFLPSFSKHIYYLNCVFRFLSCQSVSGL